MKHKKSEYLWKCYCRVLQARNDLGENTSEYVKLNQIGWRIIEKYVDAILKEMGK